MLLSQATATSEAVYNHSSTHSCSVNLLLSYIIIQAMLNKALSSSTEFFISIFSIHPDKAAVL